MRGLSLRQKVRDGVLRMDGGDETSVGKIATIEGVSKSPELYRIMQELVDEGLLIRDERTHSNGHPMFVFVRADWMPDDADSFKGA